MDLFESGMGILFEAQWTKHEGGEVGPEEISRIRMSAVYKSSHTVVQEDLPSSKL